MKTLITIESPKGGMEQGYNVVERYVEEKEAKKWVEEFNKANAHTSSYAYVGRR